MDVKVDDPSQAQQSRIQLANREIILSAALDVFSAYGLRGSTLDQIAAKAGMSKPNLLYYYRRKQDIYAAVLERTLAEWLAPFEAIDPRGEPLDELRRYITRKLAMSAEQPAASRLFAGEILSGAPVVGTYLTTRLRALVDEKAEVIGRWVREGRLAPVDPHHLIFAIWATTQHYADFDVQIRAVIGGKADRPEFPAQAAQAVLTIVLDGLRPRA